MPYEYSVEVSKYQTTHDIFTEFEELYTKLGGISGICCLNDRWPFHRLGDLSVTVFSLEGKNSEMYCSDVE
jgi:hypothetical protein